MKVKSAIKSAFFATNHPEASGLCEAKNELSD
jgi:hypothetical protein